MKATNNGLFLGKRNEKQNGIFRRKHLRVSNRFRKTNNYISSDLVLQCPVCFEVLFTVHLQPEAFSPENFQANEAKQDRKNYLETLFVLVIGEGTLKEIFAAFSILSSASFSFS